MQKRELEAYLCKTYSYPKREKLLEDMEGLVWPSAPGVKFNNKQSTLGEVNSVVKKARGKSLPGLNGAPYLLYKRCLNVFRWFHKILQSTWNNLQISKQWTTAEGVPQEQNSTENNQFRPISLLNVEGKNFFLAMASHLTKYLTENGFTNVSFQKGGLSGVLGCLKHVTMIWEAI
ncbi:reverse transcriptase [Plakobranchus ocellatus]|uniref:Reverse transcriptase n=1 Tax=Plakobranchus ocellatus TaxID=259542 RepID=A0AAV3XYZ5_9GAST|nr:reverse transcriptase [Plakobranchus ocellatus]